MFGAGLFCKKTHASPFRQFLSIHENLNKQRKSKIINYYFVMHTSRKNKNSSKKHRPPPQKKDGTHFGPMIDILTTDNTTAGKREADP